MENNTHMHKHHESDSAMGHQSMLEDFKRRFIYSLIITVPILILSPMIQMWFSYNLDFPGNGYLLFTLSSLIFIYGGLPFFKGFISELKKKNPGMMTLVALAISVSYFYSSATVFGLEGEDFFWELATLIDIMLLGHYIEMKATMRAGDALEGLMKLLPEKANLLVEGRLEEVDLGELKKGDLILIRPGEKIPGDAQVEGGTSYVNESMISGEALPVKKEPGDYLIGGSINNEGSLEARVTALGQEGYLSKVIELVKKAQRSSSRTQNLASRSAFYLTILALVSGIMSFSIWYYLRGDLSFALTRMATVMVIACPHALGLAMPLVVSRFMGESARKGLLIKNKTAFEDARKVDLVVFDKTGTLTKGTFELSSIEIFNKGSSEDELLTLAASLERHSEHPLAQALVEEAKKRELPFREVENFHAMKGRGIRGEIDGKIYQVVSPGYLEEKGIKEAELKEVSELSTRVYLLEEETLLSSFSLRDALREDSRQAVEGLRAQGIKVWMLTGDSEASASYLADKLELDGYKSQVLPHEKEELIKSFQKDHYVAMTGDGINDAPALARADLGIAMGSGTDIAADTADVILVNSSPKDVISLLKFARISYRKMIENLIWATAYNLIAIPLAAGLLYKYKIFISPALGAILMSLSTVIVAINARLLSYKD